MRIEVYLVLSASAAVLCLRRGPHHPAAQTPVERRHHHYRPTSDKLTGDTQLLRDARHIEEDASVLSPETLSNMSPEELEFHYFLAHDFDKNSMLDGLELLKAVYHTIEHEDIEGNPDFNSDASIEPKADNFDNYIGLVDQTLLEDDKDNDGYVSYAEYRAARDRSDIKNANKNNPHILAAISP